MAPLQQRTLVGIDYDRRIIAPPQAAVNRFAADANKLVARMVSEGKWSATDVINMGIGDCTVPLPEGVISAHGATLRKKRDSSYTPVPGLPEVREGMAKIFSGVLDVGITAENVLITPGSRTAVDIFIKALSRYFPDMKVLVAIPTWATYADNTFRACGQNGKMVTHELPRDGVTGYVPLNAEILEEQLRLHPEVKCVVIVNPHNPLGHVMSESEAKRMAGVLARYDVFALEDATYWPMVYGNGGFNSLLRAAFELDGTSKNALLNRLGIIMGLQKLSMSGERVSSIVVPHPGLRGSVLTELTAGHGATNRSAQELALALYSDETAVNGVVEELAMRRVMLARAINAANEVTQSRLGVGTNLIESFSIAGVVRNTDSPGGGFYTTARFSDAAVGRIPDGFRTEGTLSQDTLLRFLIERAGIVIQPAATTLLTDPQVVRVSYGAASSEHIDMLPERLVSAFLGQH